MYLIHDVRIIWITTKYETSDDGPLIKIETRNGLLVSLSKIRACELALVTVYLVFL
jgi:hypothetical protein